MNWCGYYMPDFGMRLFSPPGLFWVPLLLASLLCPPEVTGMALLSFLNPVVIPSQMP